MSSRALLGLLVRTVQDDIVHCGDMEKLLAEQQVALAGRETERLARVNARIEPLLQRLNDSARHRSEQLGVLGLSADEQGMTRLLDKLPVALASELQPLWQRLKQGLSQCQRINEHNGQLLADQRELLEQLTGSSTNTDYGPESANAGPSAASLAAKPFTTSL